MNTNLTGISRSIQTGLARIPTLTVTGESGLHGNFYLSFISVPAIVQLNGSGEVIWADEASVESEPIPESYTIPEGQEFPDGRGWWDFKKIIGTDGKVYYSYHAKVEDGDDHGVSGYHPGKRVILLTDHLDPNESAPDRKELTLLPDDDYPKYGIAKDNYVDGHDFLMFTPDHYILSSYRFDEGSNKVYSYLQEALDGKVVWRWSSILYDDLSDLKQEGTDPPEDTVHFNSMCLDSDGNLICSFRHKDTIAKISRGANAPSGVGEILWKLSGNEDEFELTDDQKPNHQHYVRRESDSGSIEQNDTGGACSGGDTKLTCFDNQNSTGETRIATYTINQNKKTLTAIETWEIPGKYSSACGSVQHIRDGIYVIGWGNAQYPRDISLRECMTVYDFENNKTLMSVTLDSHHGYNFTYRCVYSD